MEGYLSGATIFILIRFNLKSRIDKRYVIFTSTGGKRIYASKRSMGGIQEILVYYKCINEFE